MNRDALERLSKDELIALVLALTAQIDALTKRVGELEAKLGQPPKTPDNSSLPPSQGRKPEKSGDRQPAIYTVLPIIVVPSGAAHDFSNLKRRCDGLE